MNAEQHQSSHTNILIHREYNLWHWMVLVPVDMALEGVSTRYGNWMVLVLDMTLDGVY
jgi:hypothetical protein